MKFTHSERVLHEVNFNPPCNVYNLAKVTDTKVLSGSLAGPTILSSEKNTFGYDKRFQQVNENNQGPGPAQYYAHKKQIIYDFKKNLSNPKKFLKDTFRSEEQNPSIPYKVLSEKNLDEEDKIFLKQLSLIQNPASAAQKTHKKEPVYSFAKSPRKLLPETLQQKKQKSKNYGQKDIFHPQFDKIQQKGYLESIHQVKQHNQNSQGKRKLVIFNEAIKKASKMRNQIINNITPDFVPSLELIDLMSKMKTKYVPGPGAYNPNNRNQFTSAIDNLLENGKKGTVFSTVKRFNLDKKQILGPGTYDVNYESFSKKGGLISKQKRGLLNAVQMTDISHRFYINPDFKVPSQSQRSQSCTNLRKKISQVHDCLNAFGSSSKRFQAISAVSNQEDKKSQLSEYEMQKRKSFKIQLKARIKKLNSEDRRSTKQDSGLLSISTMASAID